MNGIWIVLGTALVFALLGAWYSWKSKINLESFLVARKSTRFWANTLTIVASAMGGWILFSPAESTILDGIVALLGYALGSAAAIWVFAWLGMRLRRAMPKGSTLNEFVLHRYGKGMYLFVLAVTVLYMGVFLAAEMTGIYLAAQLAFGVPLGATALIIGLGTLAYVVIGGLKASIFTDLVQSWVILPCLAIVFVASLVFAGGAAAVLDKTELLAPNILDWSSGWGTALVLVIAIVGAHLFHHGYWQRVFTAKSEKVMKRSYLVAGWIVVPMILLVGAFGLFSIASGVDTSPSIALFSFIVSRTPFWLVVTTMILAVALVMSSVDTLLNGLVSLFTIDLFRIKPNVDRKKMLRMAQLFTLVIGGLSILVAQQALSVLYLFLIADLVCVAVAFPAFYGLYEKRFSGGAAVLASIFGLAAGAAFFPTPDFGASVTSLLGIPLPGSLLWSFVLATIVPIGVSLILRALSKREPFDFKKLRKEGVEL